LEGWVSVLISPSSEQVGPGYLIVVSYDWHGCDVCILLPSQRIQVLIINVKIEVILQPTVCRSVCLDARHVPWAQEHIFIIVTSVGLLICSGFLSNDRAGLFLL
jgi:hypothetical protein